MDEPEAALHPEAIVRFLNVLSLLAVQGVQIFMATHSYFVLKKLQLLARQSQKSIPVLSVSGKEPVLNDLKDGMPDNPIVNTSKGLGKDQRTYQRT